MKDTNTNYIIVILSKENINYIYEYSNTKYGLKMHFGQNIFYSKYYKEITANNIVKTIKKYHPELFVFKEKNEINIQTK